MYPKIDTVVFVTDDRRHVSVTREGHEVTCHWPLCDDAACTRVNLSNPTHMEYDEGELLRLAEQVYVRCMSTSNRILHKSNQEKTIDAYFEVLRRLIP